MPQLNYNLDIAAACAGQVVEGEHYSGRYECSEDLPFGRVVALHTDGKLRLPRHGDKLAGVTPYRAAMPNGGYKSGDVLAVLREGQIWVETAGTAPLVTALQSPHVMASTTTATDRGKLTSDATSASSGSEIDAMPAAAACIKVAAANSGSFSFGDNAAMVLLTVDFLGGAVGPTGATGATGATGPTGPTGPTG